MSRSRNAIAGSVGTRLRSENIDSSRAICGVESTITSVTAPEASGNPRTGMIATGGFGNARSPGVFWSTQVNGMCR